MGNPLDNSWYSPQPSRTMTRKIHVPGQSRHKKINGGIVMGATERCDRFSSSEPKLTGMPPLKSHQCRLCMSDRDKVYIDILNESVEKKIHDCLNYEFIVDDNISSSICIKCYDKVIELSEFQSVCMSNEKLQRERLGLPIATINQKMSQDAQPSQSPNLANISALRQNIAVLEEKLVAVTQQRDVFQSKLEELHEENSNLKASVVQYSKTLPDVTTKMTNLLSKFEQYLPLISNQTESAETTNELSTEVQSPEHEQETHNVLTWKMASAKGIKLPVIGNSASKLDQGKISSVPPGGPQITYVCDPVAGNIQEVQINCNFQDPLRDSSCLPKHAEKQLISNIVADDALATLPQPKETVVHIIRPAKQSTVSQIKSRNVETSNRRKKLHYEVIVPRRTFKSS